jgi:hypothetical protein
MENRETIAAFFMGERQRLMNEIIADKATKLKKKGRTKNASRLAFALEYVNSQLMEAQKAEPVSIMPTEQKVV